MPILAFPPVRWNPFRLRPATNRLTLPPRTLEGSVLLVRLSDRDATSKVTLESVVELFLRHPDHSVVLFSDDPAGMVAEVRSYLGEDVPRNILFGVEVSTQEDADVRIPGLSDSGTACVVLVSPPRGVINLNLADNDHIQWVIVEGDRGEGSRPTHPVWIRALLTQSVFHQVAFRFEGWGDWVENIIDTGDGHALHVPKTPGAGYSAVHVSGLEAFNLDNPYDPFDPDMASSPTFGIDAGWTMMRRVGARESGRDIDGRTWDEAPLLEDI